MPEGIPELPELPPLPPAPEMEEELPEFPELEAPPIRRYTRAPMAPREIAPPEEAKVFVRIDKYRDIMKTIEGMEYKMDELHRTLNKISGIKNKEFEIVEGWAAMLAEAKAKLDEVSSKLVTPSE